MKAGLKSDSLAPLHYFSVVHESIAWSSCSSAELASSLIHEAKLTLYSLNLLLLKTKTLHFVLESTYQLYIIFFSEDKICTNQRRWVSLIFLFCMIRLSSSFYYYDIIEVGGVLFADVFAFEMP